MTETADTVTTVVSDPASPRGIWFLGSLVKMPLSSKETGGQLAVIEHNGPRGYSAPMHRHQLDDETFIVLEGGIHVVSDEKVYKATAGATIFLPKGTLHGFIVETGSAHFLTVHTPGGFDEFTLEAGHEVVVDTSLKDAPMPQGLTMPTREELTQIAQKYGIEILGPPPALPSDRR